MKDLQIAADGDGMHPDGTNSGIFNRSCFGRALEGFYVPLALAFTSKIPTT